MADNESNSTDPQKRVFDKARPQKSISCFKFLAIALLFLSAAAFGLWKLCIDMPGESFQPVSDIVTVEDSLKSTTVETRQQRTNVQTELQTANRPATSTDESEIIEEDALAKELRSYVVHLAETIGERNIARYTQLCASADYIEERFQKLELKTERQTFQCRGVDCYNVAAELIGTKLPGEFVIVGAHYDSVEGTPGANDNGSGTAAMLALANHFKDFQPERTVRFVAFANEEPPYFQNRGEMGSWVYAEACRRQDLKITAVLSLETMGYFSDEENSQKYPPPLNLMYPSTGNFIGFVSNVKSRRLQQRVISTFRQHAKIPSEGASLPAQTPGVGWSDHWSFWQEGYQGIMITDTAPFRYPHYHKATDTPEQLDYKRLAKVVEGLKFVIKNLSSAKTEKN